MAIYIEKSAGGSLEQREAGNAVGPVPPVSELTVTKSVDCSSNVVPVGQVAARRDLDVPSEPPLSEDVDRDAFVLDGNSQTSAEVDFFKVCAAGATIAVDPSDPSGELFPTETICPTETIPPGGEVAIAGPEYNDVAIERITIVHEGFELLI
jgi:hypothetical protein